MSAFFDYNNFMIYNPLIIDAIVECLTNYFYTTIYQFKQEKNSQTAGTGLYRVLPNVSDDLAFRKRTQTTKTSYPILPFTNFRWYDIDEDNVGDKYTNFGFNTGLMDELYQMKIKLIPSMIQFNSASWLSRQDDMFSIRKILQKQRNYGKIKLSLENYLLINRQPAPLYIFLEFEKPDISRYSDIDYLESNKITSVSHPFTVRYMDMILEDAQMVDSFELEVVSVYNNWEDDVDHETDLDVLETVNVDTLQNEDYED